MDAPQREIETFLILADISGYTDFMSFNRQETVHAQHVISALIESLIDAAPPPLAVNKLEGDAVFLHAANSPETPAAVARAAVDFFQAFDDKRREMALGNACPCKACVRIRHLDLKVLVHFGKALLYRIKGFEELSGFDVVLAHRLLKNHVGAKRYLLATDEAWDRFDPKPELPTERRRESYEGVGGVDTVVARIPADSALLPDNVVPAKGLARLADILSKHGAELAFALGLRKFPPPLSRQ